MWNVCSECADNNSNLRVGWYLPVNVNAFFNSNSTHTHLKHLHCELWCFILLVFDMCVCVKIKWFGTRSFPCCCNSENNRTDALLSRSVKEQKKRENVKKNAIALGYSRRCALHASHSTVKNRKILYQIISLSSSRWMSPCVNKKKTVGKPNASTYTNALPEETGTKICGNIPLIFWDMFWYVVWSFVGVHWRLVHSIHILTQGLYGPSVWAHY